jgi:hypothetical protein
MTSEFDAQKDVPEDARLSRDPFVGQSTHMWKGVYREAFSRLLTPEHMAYLDNAMYLQRVPEEWICDLYARDDHGYYLYMILATRDLPAHPDRHPAFSTTVDRVLACMVENYDTLYDRIGSPIMARNAHFRIYRWQEALRAYVYLCRECPHPGLEAAARLYDTPIAPVLASPMRELCRGPAHPPFDPAHTYGRIICQLLDHIPSMSTVGGQMTVLSTRWKDQPPITTARDIVDGRGISAGERDRLCRRWGLGRFMLPPMDRINLHEHRECLRALLTGTDASGIIPAHLTVDKFIDRWEEDPGSLRVIYARIHHHSDVPHHMRYLKHILSGPVSVHTVRSALFSSPVWDVVGEFVDHRRDLCEGIRDEEFHRAAAGQDSVFNPERILAIGASISAADPDHRWEMALEIYREILTVSGVRGVSYMREYLDSALHRTGLIITNQMFADALHPLRIVQILTPKSSEIRDHMRLNNLCRGKTGHELAHWLYGYVCECIDVRSYWCQTLMKVGLGHLLRAMVVVPPPAPSQHNYGYRRRIAQEMERNPLLNHAIDHLAPEPAGMAQMMAMMDHVRLQHVKCEPPASPLAKSVPDLGECVVCMDAVRTHTLGCGHLCLCEPCTKSTRLCPICRVPITVSIRVYLS